MTLVCSVMAWGATITVGEGGDQATLSDAVAAAEAGDVVQLVSDLTGESCEFNKAITVDFNGHTIQSSNYGLEVTATVTFTDNSLAQNGGIIAGKGCLDVYGKAIINGGTFTSTVTGSGAAIWCENGSEIEVNDINMNASETGIYVESGRMIINGGNIVADKCVALQLGSGYFEINGGTIVSNSSLTNQGRDGGRSYAVISGGTFVMNGGSISGVQGGLSLQEDCAGTINHGEIETRYGVDGEHNNHYALYVSTGAVVNVYDGKFKVETPSMGGNRVVLIGNNDAYNYYGVVNMYGGKYQEKAYVTKQKNAESHFPASVPLTSAWYTAFQEKDAANAFAPLPAGYEYYDITEGEDYEAGYRYGVRPIAGKAADGIDADAQAAQEADPTYTIPWQQATTWASDAVPVENTIVTIPVDATVTVSNAEATKTAVADQVFVSQGATLKVETGTTLNIGEGGMNIGNGGQIVVEPGAVVTVGEAGIITTEDEALVIEATEEDQGVLLLHPEVTENTQPKATVKLITKAKQVGANEFIWERFAIPTLDGSATTYNNEGLDTVHYYGGATSLQEGLYEWSDASQDWVGVASWKDLKPFKGYQLTNNSKYGNVVYTFEGNLVGNNDQAYEFAQSGFGFFGNSYTGDIDIKKFMESFGENMQKTIWIYDYYTDAFKAITEASYGTIYYGKRNDRHGLITDIRSMQAFLMNTFAEGESATSVNYLAAIWGNPKYGVVPAPAPAPARSASVDEDQVTIYVSGEKQEDEVTFIRNNEYSSAFDNGADASKWMNKGINLYVTTENGEMSSVASDNIDNTLVAFQSGNETQYTLGFDNLRGEAYILRDVLTGAEVNMVEGATYTFSQEANTTIPARFQIIAPAKVPTGMENAEGATVQQKVMKNGVLYILRDNKWYSAQGQIVK